MSQRYAVQVTARGNVALVDRWDGMVPARCVALFTADPHRPGRAEDLARRICAWLNETDTSWHPSGAPAARPIPAPAPTPQPTATSAPAPTPESPSRTARGRILPADWDERDGLQKAAWMANRAPKEQQGTLG